MTNHPSAWNKSEYFEANQLISFLVISFTFSSCPERPDFRDEEMDGGDETFRLCRSLALLKNGLTAHVPTATKYD